MTKEYNKSGTKEYISKKMIFYINILFFHVHIEFDRNVRKSKKMESGFLLLVLKIYYWRATTIAPIKAAKRIIEMSSNGRKKSVDK